jgi:predicted ester cyclase
MSAEYNKKLVEDMYVALNTKDLDALDKYWHDDMIWHGPPGFDDIYGLTNFKEQVMKPFYAAFPDYYVENDIVCADEKWVSATGYLTGTHKGVYLDIEPTGKAIKMQFSDFWLVKDGKFSENFVMVDNYSVLKQMGLNFS